MDSAVQRRFGAAGWGCRCSKGWRELLGGRVWLESTVGEGLDIFRGDPLGVPGRGGGNEQRDAEASKGSSCDLVVIDDEEVSRYLIRQTVGPGIARWVEADRTGHRGSHWRGSRSHGASCSTCACRG